MSLETLVGDMGGGRTRAVLVCGCSGRPVNLPTFDDWDDAESFLVFAREHGIRDVRGASDVDREAMHTLWLASKSGAL